MCVLLRNGRTNWQFARFSRKTASKSQRGLKASAALFFQDVGADDMKAPAEKDAKGARRFRVCVWIKKRWLGRQSAALRRGSGKDMPYAI
jgi:hypothetical protein